MDILEVVSQFIEVTVLRKTLSFLTNYLAFLAMESSLSPIDTIQQICKNIGNLFQINKTITNSTIAVR